MSYDGLFELSSVCTNIVNVFLYIYIFHMFLEYILVQLSVASKVEPLCVSLVQINPGSCHYVVLAIGQDVNRHVSKSFFSGLVTVHK